VRQVSVLAKIVIPVVGLVVILAIWHIARVSGPNAPTASAAPAQLKPQIISIPLCSGEPPAASPIRQAPAAGSTRHSVTLSWNPSLPVSNSPNDAIKGYYVYRSQSPETYTDGNRINSLPLVGTQCLDNAVEPRATYYYVVKAVAKSGAQSVVSREIKAVIPFP
jgi:hypothetical protein